MKGDFINNPNANKLKKCKCQAQENLKKLTQEGLIFSHEVVIELSILSPHFFPHHGTAYPLIHNRERSQMRLPCSYSLRYSALAVTFIFHFLPILAFSAKQCHKPTFFFGNIACHRTSTTVAPMVVALFPEARHTVPTSPVVSHAVPAHFAKGWWRCVR